MNINNRFRKRFRDTPDDEFIQPGSRRGVTTVEVSVSLLLLLSVLFAMLDLGLLAFQSNMLSLAAREVTREAIVRGSAIDPSMAWGPGTCSGTAGDGSSISQVLAPFCVTIPKSSMTFHVTWPDGANRIDNRVTTNLRFQRKSMTPLTSWMGTVNLQANCTMNIIH